MYNLELTCITDGQYPVYSITLTAPTIKHLIALLSGVSSTLFNGVDVGVKLTRNNDLKQPFLLFVYDLDPREFKPYLVKELRALKEF